MDIFLDSKIITNKELSSDAIAVYIALRMMQNLKTNKYYVNIKLLTFCLTDDIIISRKYVERLSKGLNELVVNDYVKIVVNNNEKDYILDISNLIIDTHHNENDDKLFFTIVTSEEVHKIMNLNSRLDKFSILRYFISMLSTINYNATYYDVMGKAYNNFVGFMANDYIGSLCGVTSYTTYDKYNHLLEENEMIYIYRHSILIRDEKGQLKNLPNHYGRYKDKGLIIGYSVNRENFELGEDIVDKKANESRSLMQKYYCMVKYGTEYSEKETKCIYRYVHYRNQQNLKKYEQEIEKGYSGESLINKIVPEDVFYKYDYLFENSSSDSCKIDNTISDDNWGEPNSMEQNFSIDEILDMPTEGEDQMNLTNSDCVGQSDLCINDTHGEDNHGLFAVRERNLDIIDLDELY